MIGSLALEGYSGGGETRPLNATGLNRRLSLSLRGERGESGDAGFLVVVAVRKWEVGLEGKGLDRGSLAYEVNC